MAVEVEDDLFFADLSKQIALLIMDDDEEFPVQIRQPVHLQAYHHLPESVMPPPPYTHEMAYYRRESKGTGVFIPRSSLPRRKNRSGKSTSSNNNNKSEAAVSHVANSSSRLHSNHSYANSGVLKNRT